MSRVDGFSRVPGNPTNRHRDWIKRIEIENAIAKSFEDKQEAASNPMRYTSPVAYASPPRSPTGASGAPGSPTASKHMAAAGSPSFSKAAASQASVRTSGSVSARGQGRSRLQRPEGDRMQEHELRRQLEIDMLTLRMAML